MRQVGELVCKARHVCDGLIGIVSVACLPGMGCDALGSRRFASSSSSCTER